MGDIKSADRTKHLEATTQIVRLQEIDELIERRTSSLRHEKKEVLKRAFAKVLATESKAMQGGFTEQEQSWEGKLAILLRKREAECSNTVDEDRKRAALVLSSWFTSSLEREIRVARPYIVNQIYENKPLVLYLIMSKMGDEASENKTASGTYKPDLGEFIWFKRAYAAGFGNIRIYDEFRNLILRGNNLEYSEMLQRWLNGKPHLDIEPIIPCKPERLMYYRRKILGEVLPNVRNAYGNSLSLKECIKGRDPTDINPETLYIARMLVYNFRAMSRTASDDDAWLNAARQTVVSCAKDRDATDREGLYVSHAEYEGRLKVGWPFGGGYLPAHGVPVVYMSSRSDGRREAVFEIVPEIGVMNLKRSYPEKFSLVRFMNEEGDFLAYGIGADNNIRQEDLFGAVEYAVMKNAKDGRYRITMGISNVVLHMAGIKKEDMIQAISLLGIDNKHSPDVIASVLRRLVDLGIPNDAVLDIMHRNVNSGRMACEVANRLEAMKVSGTGYLFGELMRKGEL